MTQRVDNNNTEVSADASTATLTGRLRTRAGHDAVNAAEMGVGVREVRGNIAVTG